MVNAMALLFDLTIFCLFLFSGITQLALLIKRSLTTRRPGSKHGHDALAKRERM